MLGSAVVLALGFHGASAAAAGGPWPPASGPGVLFAHFGEEHLDDPDGPRIFPKVISDVVRYRPGVVVASADKSSNGTVRNLSSWKDLMRPFDQAGIPYFAAVGNHDREAAAEVFNGLLPVAPLTNYMQVFADRPYPFGDAPPYGDPRLSPRERPGSDPPGASSHYVFDYANVRWIVLDNSCFGIVNCDSFQNPPFPDAEGSSGQYDFLARRAAEAKAKGMRVFVALHMPTQDPRPGHSAPTPSAHTMGEGASPDNTQFETAALQAGVDGVFAAHVKGQWIYTAKDVPYYTDGGAGGDVYVGSSEKVGVDSGYWHGYRLVRVLPDGTVQTDAVPVLVPNGITVSGPGRVGMGELGRFAATGRQPTEKGHKVEALELREPDRSRPNGPNLPRPARIWTSANGLLLEPAAAVDDDSRRNPRTQTESGVFRGVCPGRTSVEIAAGMESKSVPVTVGSAPGRIVQGVRRGPRTIRRGRPTMVARIRLGQHAETLVQVRKGRRVIRTLFHDCLRANALTVRWDAAVIRARRRLLVRPGVYTVEVVVRSDRPTLRRRFRVRVAGRRARTLRRPALRRIPLFTG